MSNKNTNLSLEESNAIVQIYLQQYHPTIIEEMNKVVVIANWVKQLTTASTTISPKLLEVPQMLVKDDEIDMYPVNSILKPAIEGNINAITSFLAKEPNEYELKQFLIDQSKLLADQVMYEYQQQILNK
jgi:iron-sulfur cluster repair protein YtfE (RIC family)